MHNGKVRNHLCRQIRAQIILPQKLLELNPSMHAITLRPQTFSRSPPREDSPETATSPSSHSGRRITSLPSSATLSEQIDSMEERKYRYAVEAKSVLGSSGSPHWTLPSEILCLPIDLTTASTDRQAKRKRNALASSNFRARKKARIQGLENDVKSVKEQSDIYLMERDFYRGECCFYVNFIRDHLGPHVLPPRPLSPHERYWS
jgi:hypothetical protein